MRSWGAPGLGHQSPVHRRTFMGMQHQNHLPPAFRNCSETPGEGGLVLTSKHVQVLFTKDHWPSASERCRLTSGNGGGGGSTCSDVHREQCRGHRKCTGSFAGATGVTKTLQAGSWKAVWSSGFLLSGCVVCRSVDMEGLAPKEDVKINYPKLTAETVHMSEVVSSRERIRVPAGSQLACGLGPGTQATPHLLHLQTEPGCLPLTET